MPDGTIVGARGPFAMLAPDTGLRRWFHNAYRKRYLVELAVQGTARRDRLLLV